MKRFATLTTALMLLLTLGVFAQVNSSSSAKASSSSSRSKSSGIMTRQSSGTISSIEANRLVLTHKVRGKEVQTTFMINDQTKKEGELKPGDKAMVHYRVENGKDIATMVKGSTTVAKNSKRK